MNLFLWARCLPSLSLSKLLFSGCAVTGLAVLPCISSAQAYSDASFSPFVIKDIKLEGLQRIEAGTVFSAIGVKEGDRLDAERASQVTKRLFALGFFKDVRLQVTDDVLLIQFDERPAIATVTLNGIKEFDKEQIKKSLKDLGLAESRIFDRALLDKSEQELKRQYQSRGKYSAQVTTTVTPLERNRVAIVVNVVEGDVSRIKGVNIIGNKAFSQKQLTQLITLTPSNLWSFYTKNDQYSKQKLSGDLEALRSFYLNQGYLEFNVESTQVTISPDKQDIFIAINVNEGEQYKVNKVTLAGELMGAESSLTSLVKLKPNEIFDNQKLTESTKAINDYFAGLGYAFASANASPEFNREQRTVDFTIYVDPGRRVYIRRINIAGNTRTRDEVVRREFRQMEASWYDSNKIKLSRERIDRLGYFKDVEVDTVPVAGTADMVDVNLKVSERPTGNLIFGVGLSSSDKLILSGSINQQNFMGTGKAVNFEANTSRINKVLAFSVTDPYVTPDGISRSIDVYQRRFNPNALNLGDYQIETRGASLRFGVPFTEYDRVFFGLGYEATKLDVNANSPKRFINYVDSFGNDSQNYIATVGWARDSRDSSLVPTQGRYQRFNAEISLPNSDAKYSRTVYQQQYFHKINKDFTLAFNGEIGLGRAYGGKPYPFFKNFYAGGIGSVRGYSPSSLGPRDAAPNDNVSLGGSSRVLLNAELLFPIPGTGNDRTLRGFTFVDGGNVFQTGDTIGFNALRYSAGLGLSWISPVGPLKLSYAKALNDKDNDRVQKLQFQIGTGF
jgi:outer membrane protein insertion porin family